ncbi:MAG: gamma-glutamylcyclotransferase [Planctomycetales bacterium]|nr:gamma-glutamylcyclotransferase [Planctomycetales bacterium]NIM09303.1 gamma-glutamylcyclotransferase [Planctomycetales bacterium]NIN08771.1 gamma-glutamylcyclotransferase [Planctomycetales bacterium]NIN77888.1 gamma-glutamylcyclotransferase [Planctomycetales bacterium]NIO35071.1 gamma-glutamylcyclotransferase [Planctomycetales bacterium]
MKLFIYGTLKRGQSRHALLSGQRFLGTARTQPAYRLYDLGAYPGLVADQRGYQVEGEVWEIDDQCLARLDQVEGVPRLYRRAIVQLQGGRHAGVQTYLYEGPLADQADCGARWPSGRPGPIRKGCT